MLKLYNLFLKVSSVQWFWFLIPDFDEMLPELLESLILSG